MKRIYALLLCILLAIGSAAPVSAAGENSKPADAFSLFSENVTGRYVTTESDDLIVLDLIPAFGRLFASVARYMNGTSLYSYYAAEILPLCPPENESCPYSHTPISYDLYIRLFSNMALGGDYWPEKTFQRIALISGGIMLSDYFGGGDALVSKTDTPMRRSDTAPSIFTYGPDMAAGICGGEGCTDIPEEMTGTWKAEWQTDGVTTFMQFTMDTDGTIVMLRDKDTGIPPLLLKGGCSVADAAEGARRLCYITSSPSGGTMPYDGCVLLRQQGDHLSVERDPEWGYEWLLPDNAARILYERPGL